MILESWGASPDEIQGSVIGDNLCPTARLIATRSISIPASPEIVFPWIRQMGFGRAGWYSYDWIDNVGRKSASAIHDEWQNVQPGDSIPGGPISFTAAIVEPPHAFVLEVKSDDSISPRLHFTLAYELRPTNAGTRLVTRMRAHINLPGGKAIERLFLGPGDGLMLRRQLLNLRKVCTA